MGIVRLAVCDGCQKAVMVSAREGLNPDGWHWIYPCDSGLAKLYCVPCSAARRPRGMDSQALDHELGVYRSRLDELLGTGDVNEGKFVVIKGDDVSEVIADLDSALLLGYERFGNVTFLVRKIERVETIHRI